ncbi:hypothetical protein ANCDUO_01563 [Ancylostoma duodenale]|uniref:Uncharacterized protein n=1 Tax=Ancylostoma duodenale TaxID=51022 RepID=A0A0C2DYL1_9BILA|nr:hypothetical protein ANCDUO_01563 [Ancylostoma duodenale]
MSFGKKAAEEETRWMSTTRHQRTTLIAALLASYNANAGLLKDLYNLSAFKRLKICHLHFIEAAQFMGVQMMLAGYNFHHLEGVPFEKAAEIIAPADIPTSLLNQLNRFVGDFDGELRLTARQVAAFTKDAVGRYYTALGWELATQREVRRQRNVLIQETDAEMVCEEHRNPKMEHEGEPNALAFDAEMVAAQERSFATLLAELEGEIGSVQHFWDGWHLVKWFGNNLRKTHLWRAIEVGEGERIRHIFNMCLRHVQDVHAWLKDETTGKITSPLFTYKLYTMLSTMHFNTLRFAEMAGERKVQRVIDVQRKYFRGTTRMVFKTAVEHLWRYQIAQAVLDARREHHELPHEDVDLQGMIDAEAAFEEAEPEDILEFCDSDDDEYEEEL